MVIEKIPSCVFTSVSLKGSHHKPILRIFLVTYFQLYIWSSPQGFLYILKPADNTYDRLTGPDAAFPDVYTLVGLDKA